MKKQWYAFGVGVLATLSYGAVRYAFTGQWSKDLIPLLLIWAGAFLLVSVLLPKD